MNTDDNRSFDTGRVRCELRKAYADYTNQGHPSILFANLPVQRSHHAGEIKKCSFISSVWPIIHSYPSRMPKETEGIWKRLLLVSKWTENILNNWAFRKWWRHDNHDRVFLKSKMTRSDWCVLNSCMGADIGIYAIDQSLRIKARKKPGKETGLTPGVNVHAINPLFSDMNHRHLTSSAFQYSF